MDLVLRRPARDLDVNRRTPYRLFGCDRWNLRTLEDVACHLGARLADAAREGNGRAAWHIRRRLRLLVRFRQSIMYVAQVPLPVFGEAIRLDTVSTNMQLNALLYFRFTMPQLRELYTALRVPDDFRCSSGHGVHGETAFLVAIYKMASGLPYAKMQDDVRMQHTLICRVCNSFFMWLHRTWGYLVHDNMPFFVPRLAPYAEAVRAYLGTKYNLDFPPVGDPGGGFNIALFIDCCVFGIGDGRPPLDNAVARGLLQRLVAQTRAKGAIGKWESPPSTRSQLSHLFPSMFRCTPLTG